jgi:hypothetical protein
VPGDDPPEFDFFDARSAVHQVNFERFALRIAKLVRHVGRRSLSGRKFPVIHSGPDILCAG